MLGFQRLVWFVGYTIVLLIATEIFARFALGWTTIKYSRPYQPIYVSGDFVGAQSRDVLINSSSGPESNGYEPTKFGFYLWNGQDAPKSSDRLSDFLFANYRSRYLREDVDNITCRYPEALTVYILGGSLAVGTAASDKSSTWHALLEDMLRKDLQRSDIYLFNAAMGAFVSAQERLAYQMTAFPRGARFVLMINGYNDLFIPASNGSRPGDPMQLGVRYTQMYSAPLKFWLAEESAIFSKLLEWDEERAILNRRALLASDDGVFERYANAVVDLYLENVSATLRTCEAIRANCLVGIQPSRTMSEIALNVPSKEPTVLPPGRVKTLYVAE